MDEKDTRLVYADIGPNADQNVQTTLSDDNSQVQYCKLDHHTVDQESFNAGKVCKLLLETR